MVELRGQVQTQSLSDEGLAVTVKPALGLTFTGNTTV